MWTELYKAGIFTGKPIDVFFTAVSEVSEAFGLDNLSFETKYGFTKPDTEIGDRLVVTCRYVILFKTF